MKVFNFAESRSLVNQFMMELRDVDIQKDMLRFRHNIRRIGQIIAYEISKTVGYSEQPTTTCLGTATSHTVSEPVVLATILRAGLPLHQGMNDMFDHAENAFVSAYRKYIDEKKFLIHIEYMASPRIDGKTLIICDPMLATGSSMELAYEALRTKGKPAKIHLVSVIASRQAIEFLEKKLTGDITLWVGAIDDEINDHKYIVPGLGDAGDLCYGEKE
ncbi:MAG: uracil phosphoribosyltransferase [Candidatus Limisoma sp.]